MTERRTQQKVTVLLNRSYFVGYASGDRVALKRESYVSDYGTVIAVEDVPVPMSDAEERDALVKAMRHWAIQMYGLDRPLSSTRLGGVIREAGLAHLFPEVTK